MKLTNALRFDVHCLAMLQPMYIVCILSLTSWRLVSVVYWRETTYRTVVMGIFSPFSVLAVQCMCMLPGRRTVALHSTASTAESRSCSNKERMILKSTMSQAIKYFWSRRSVNCTSEYILFEILMHYVLTHIILLDGECVCDSGSDPTI